MTYPVLINIVAFAMYGMYTFRHKTKQKKYTITVPLILILQIAALLFLLSGCGAGGASYEQISLIYCRSGNRSKDASQKLADMGYTNVYEFGGINTWEGDIVTDQL